MDGVDLRSSVSPVDPQLLLEPPGESSDSVRKRVERAKFMQENRYRNYQWESNAELSPGEMNRFTALDSRPSMYFAKAVSKLGFSSRAAHAVLRVARTLADLDGREELIEDDVLEAVQHRRLGGRDLYWMTL